MEPRRFERGEAIRQQRATRPPAQHSEITRDRELLEDIKKKQRVETRKEHYYWHDSRGTRYAHYYDRNGIHWYGFYHGPRFYWSRYYYDNWWWYDEYASRWLFWWSGYWWWRGPGGAAFVYMDDNYYPYDTASGKVVVQKAETENPPKSPPPLEEGENRTSPDKSRIVQVYGGNSEAFLYDNSGSKPVYIAYLGRDISKIKFTEGGGILADFKDGSFAVYDMNGVQKNNPPSAPPRAVQPPSPGPPPLAPPSTGQE